MQPQLSKSILCLLLTLFLTCPNAFGQWSKKGKNTPQIEDVPAFKIINNNLKDFGDLQLIIAPLKWDIGNVTNISAYVEGNYQLNDQLSIGAYTGIGYLFDARDVNLEFESTELIKNPLQFGLQGEYNFSSKKKKKEYKIVVESESTGYREITNYYVPVKGNQFIKMGARMGFNFQKIAAGTSFHRFKEVEFKDEGLVNTTSGYIHLGVSRTKIDKMEVDIEGFGEKNEKDAKYIYLDVLINTNTSFDTAVPLDENSFIATDEFKTLPVGIRLGYRVTPFSKKNWYCGYELGVRPGPSSEAAGQLNSNSYISVTLGVGSMLSIK